MLTLDELIAIYRQRFRDSPPDELPRFQDITQTTITYLVAFKQIHEALKRLACTYEEGNPEGD